MAIGFDTNFSQGFTKQSTPTAGYFKNDASIGIGYTINAIFKEWYLPGIHDLLNSKRILSRYIRRNTEDVAGAYAVIALNTGRNEGVTFIDEGGKLPDPGKQVYQRAMYRLRNNYARILVSGQAMQDSRSDRGAYVRVLDAEVRGITRDIQHENNRVMFGDGSGRLSLISNATPAANYFSVNKPGGFDNNQGLGSQYLRPNMRVAVNATGTTWAPRTMSDGSLTSKVGIIEAVDYVNGAVKFKIDGGSTVTSIASVAVGDQIVRVSESTQAATYSESDSAFLNEPFGLAAIVSDGNPFGPADEDHYLGAISATNNTTWQAYIIDNGGTTMPFNQDLLQQAQDGLDILGDGVVQLYITTHGIRRQYVNSLIANKRYVNTMELDGGYSAIEFDGRPVVVDKDCTRGRIYGLDLETLMMFQANDYQWIDDDGSVLNRLGDRHGFQATLWKMWQFGTNARNRNCGVFDIQDT